MDTVGDDPGREPNTYAGSARGIPATTVARLPVYLRALNALAEQGVPVTSSQELADAAGVNPAKVRKDLSYLGSHGIRGVGYEVDRLSQSITAALGLTQDWDVAIVGAGNLGRALADYRGFATRGFRIAAIFDASPELIGRSIAGLDVQPVDRLGQVVRDLHIAIGVVATPAEVAQDVVDALIAAGVRAVLNFAPCVLQVPPEVTVRKVDLSTELQILAFHEQRRVER